jgi:hypothetical protein
MTIYAAGNDAKSNIYNDVPYHYLATNSSPISQSIFVHNRIETSIDSSLVIVQPTQMSGVFNNTYISIEAGLIQSNQLSNWSKYYFQGELTLHKHDKFNLLLMANIEQLRNLHSLYVVNNNNHTSLVKNLTRKNETELNYSYGLIGSYSINSTWQLSGGIVHTQALDEPNSNTWHINSNMALIGTTYSF